MDTSTIDLKVFAPRYRQALLYTMIEGLIEGSSFSFFDDRNPNEIENELIAAGLTGYRWFRKDGRVPSEASYLIERQTTASTESDHS